MNLKFENEKSYDIAYKFLEGNGFCFRSRRMDLVLEFYFELARREAIVFFEKLGLDNQFQLID